MTDEPQDRHRVLVTNDDGVWSPGLHALARRAVDAGHDVVVAAPDGDMSGTGASIGKLHADRHIDAERVTLPGVADVEAYAVAGPPGLCVLAGRLGGFGRPPDLVLSGINPGCNTGRSILHSGTVGAALTAANFGISGVAVSIDVDPGRSDDGDGDDDGRDGGGPDGAGHELHWGTAAELGGRGLAWAAGAPVGTVLNINVPDLPLDRLRGARWARLADFGTVRSAVVEPADTGGRLQVELRPAGTPAADDTDTGLVQAGFVAVTTLIGVRAAEPVEVGPVVGLPAGAPGGQRAPGG